MFLLGLGEAANFPACIKTVAEWFPKRERALATGIFNSGANIGNMVVPVDRCRTLGGAWSAWRGAFVVAGSLGFVWLIFWLIYYRRPEQHRSVSKAELALILSDPGRKDRKRSLEPRAAVQGNLGLRHRQVPHRSHLVVLLFWIPGYLQTTFHLSLSQSRIPVMLAYAISIIGSVGGGSISSVLIKRGISPNVARKTTMLLCVLFIAPIFATPFVHHLWVVVALLGLATAGHQGWSANLFTLPSDMFPKVRCGQRHRHWRNGGRGRRRFVAVGHRVYRLSHAQLCDAVHHRVPRLPVGVARHSRHLAQVAPAQFARRR